MTRFPTVKGRPSLPQAFEGQIYQQVGKYARQAVLFAFEQAGGPEGLAEWAKTNPDEFYTKLFPKIIARESDVRVTRGVDELMDVIDGDFVVEDAQALDSSSVADAGFEYDLDDLVEYEP